MYSFFLSFLCDTRDYEFFKNIVCVLINDSELETFLPLGDHAHRWKWWVERVMITRRGRWRQATTTSAGPPHCWRPHQLCKWDYTLFAILFTDLPFSLCYLQ